MTQFLHNYNHILDNITSNKNEVKLICKTYMKLKTLILLVFYISIFLKIFSIFWQAKVESTYHCVKNVQILSFFWSVFSHIRTEYGEIRSIPLYSVQMRGNMDQKKLHIWTLFTQFIRTKIIVFINNILQKIAISKSFNYSKMVQTTNLKINLLL